MNHTFWANELTLIFILHGTRIPIFRFDNRFLFSEKKLIPSRYADSIELFVYVLTLGRLKTLVHLLNRLKCILLLTVVYTHMSTDQKIITFIEINYWHVLINNILGIEYFTKINRERSTNYDIINHYYYQHEESKLINCKLTNMEHPWSVPHITLYFDETLQVYFL